VAPGRALRQRAEEKCLKVPYSSEGALHAVVHAAVPVVAVRRSDGQRSIGAAFFTMSCKCRAELRRHFIILGLTEGRRKGLSGSLVPAPWLQVLQAVACPDCTRLFLRREDSASPGLGWGDRDTVYCVQGRARWRTDC
jgi:hypothetical protein